MRASTLFALTAAILIGLAVAVGAKLSGYFDKPVAPSEAKKPEIQVLVAARNIFAGDLMDASWVKTRPIKPEELPHFERNKDHYLPPVANAVALRVAQKNIETDQPILKDCLQEMAKPESLSLRLHPQMRAVNVSLPKDNCAGGLIQVGEWVDVFLTSTIAIGESSSKESGITQTASIAQKLRVIGKRNGLWPVFQPLPEDRPVTFTLEANPYRAALIEFGKTKGDITLSPVSAAEQKGLEERRDVALQSGGNFFTVSFANKESKEAQEEEARVEAVVKGELAVGQPDLVRIFNIKTPEPPMQSVAVQLYGGINNVGAATFNPDGTPILVNRKDNKTSVGGNRTFNLNDIQFKRPDCKTCKDKGKKPRPTKAQQNF